MSKNTNYTVAELIKALQQFPRNLPVLVSGYEDGYENILEPKKIKLKQKIDNPYWMGEFEEVGQQKGETNIEAVVLRRVLRNV